jgi:hypothetical protein
MILCVIFYDAINYDDYYYDDKNDDIYELWYKMMIYDDFMIMMIFMIK